MGRLLKCYPQFSEHYVLYELSMLRGWAYHACAIENDAWLQFQGVRMASPGYIAREIKDLIQIAKNFDASQNKNSG